ncbi:hypothetical protein IAT38_002354 [Cryptococcus sp. DSM 104549]
MSIEDRFYALCAVSALFKWLSAEKGVEFPEQSLRICYAAFEGTMFIDTGTAKGLELVKNMLTGKTSNTLYGHLNTCYTPMGSRLLRTEILQPSNVLTEIEGRLDSVQDCLSNEVSTTGKGSYMQNARIARIFAVKAHFDPLLDVARQTYQENLLDIYDCVLYNCSEAVAQLDVLASLAHTSSGHNCVRPEFNGTFAIHSGRHPILDSTLGIGVCVPNNVQVYATSRTSHFQIIQGPNMSGKSTYLRQIGLLTIQAMIGCFRLSNDDSLEKCLSTFASEMATSAMLLGLATDHSLLLIDELGRGTSTVEGLGMSHAIAESLVARKSFVFFATHYSDLAVTLGNLQGVVNLHLQVHQGLQDFSSSSSKFMTTFAYKVIEGPSTSTHYGLELAKLAALPGTIVQRATEIAGYLSDLEEKGHQSSKSNSIAKRRKILYDLRSRLKHVSETSKLDNEALSTFLHNIRVKSQHSLSQCLQFSTRISSEEAK